jgi:hypothetical protein
MESSSPSAPRLFDVPIEILVEVAYSFLEYPDIIQFSQVCRELHEIFGPTSWIWKLLYRRDLSERHEPPKPPKPHESHESHESTDSIDSTKSPDGTYKQAYCRMMSRLASLKTTKNETEMIDHVNLTLIEAATHGYDKLIPTLIQQGAWRQNEAMNVAAEYGHLDIVKILESHRATSYWYATLQAARMGHRDIVEFFTEELGWNRRHVDAMKAAARNGHRDIVELILSQDPSMYKETLIEVMIEAAHGGHYEIVKLMLDKGADRYTHSLDAAFLMNRRDIVELLMSRGCKEYDRCLIWAAGEGYVDLVDQMLVTVAVDALTIPHYDAMHIYHCAINCALRRALDFSAESEDHQRRLDIVQRIITSVKAMDPECANKLTLLVNSLY